MAQLSALPRACAHGRGPAAGRWPPLFARPPPAPGMGAGTPASTLLYRGPGMRLLRAMVRLKAFQAAGTIAAAAPLVLVASGGEVTPSLLAGAAVTATSAGAMAACTTWYGRRYVGQLELAKPEREDGEWKLKISTLDAWGKRVDSEVDVARVSPPLLGLEPDHRSAVLRQVMMPLTVRPLVPGSADSDQYLLSPRFGRVYDREAVLALLDGTHEAFKSKAE